MFPGTQWSCSKCGSAQHGSHRFCSNCGSPLGRQNGCFGCFGCLVILLAMGIGGFLLMGATFASCVYQVAQPSSYDATVTVVRWERTIEIERNDLRTKEGPADSIPADAVQIKQKGRTKIFTYKVREWAHDRTLTASGTDHTDIRWPADTGAKGLEPDTNEREARREEYSVTMSYANQKVRFVVGDEATFRKFPLGSTRSITPMQDYVMIDGERYNR
jgi:hypothetical protein